MQTDFNIKGFKGAIVLKDWFRMPDGRNYIIVSGKISIYKDQDAVGFEVNKSESNWVARVESEDGSKSINVLGCQIRVIAQGSEYCSGITLDTLVV